MFHIYGGFRIPKVEFFISSGTERFEELILNLTFSKSLAIIAKSSVLMTLKNIQMSDNLNVNCCEILVFKYLTFHEITCIKINWTPSDFPLLSNDLSD